MFSPYAVLLPGRKQLSHSLPHRRCPPLLNIGLLGLLLGDTLVKDLGILIGSILSSLRTTALDCDPMSLVLQALGSDEALNLRGFGVGFLSLSLWLDFTTDNEFANIIFLAETEEPADLGGTLGTQALGVDSISNSGNVIVALLHNAESQNRQVHADDAATNRLALALSSSARSVAGMAFSEQESDTSRMHDTLLHGEALLVVAAGDLEDVALEFVADGIARDFSTHSPVHEDA